MAQQTTYGPFHDLSQETPDRDANENFITQEPFDDLFRAVGPTGRDTFAECNLNGLPNATAWLNYSNPESVAAQVPVGSTISRIDIQCNFEGFNFIDNDQSRYEGGQINTLTGRDNGYDEFAFIPAGIARNTITVSGTIADWNITEQQADDLLRGNGRYLRFMLRERVAQDLTQDNRLYWADIRVEYTPPPNPPRTAFITMF